MAFTYWVAEGVRAQVLGDERAIRQVLFNLLGNAVKFTSRGGVEFRVSRLAASAGATVALFEIEDTGSGIEADDLQRIFDPFDRGTAHSRVEGTGLGLSITK